MLDLLRVGGIGCGCVFAEGHVPVDAGRPDGRITTSSASYRLQ